jgi:hypothetical protein
MHTNGVQGRSLMCQLEMLINFAKSHHGQNHVFEGQCPFVGVKGMIHIELTPFFRLPTQLLSSTGTGSAPKPRPPGFPKSKS